VAENPLGHFSDDYLAGQQRGEGLIFDLSPDQIFFQESTDDAEKHRLVIER
jgi:hypothetical protein